MNRWRNSVWLLGLLVWASGALAKEAAMAWTLTSSAFQAGKAIPALYTCDGQDSSPPLAWTEPPIGTRSLALIADDPDAPTGTWVHWVMYSMPPSVRQLPAAVPIDSKLADGTQQGMSDFGRPGYGGPCPPSGTHRYVFTLYALDAAPALPSGTTTAPQLEQAMQGHILAQAQLTGTYKRRSR